MASCLELACCATAAEDLLKAQDGPATTKLWPLHLLWSFYCVFLRRFAVAYHLTLTGLFSCPTRVEAGPCCSDHGLQEAGELGAGREVAAFHSGQACELTLMSLWRARFLIKFLCVPFFLKELVATLLAGCHAKAGCQPAQRRASFLKELAASLRWRASFLKELAASLLAGVPAFLQKLAASLLGGVPVFCESWLPACSVACQLF